MIRKAGRGDLSRIAEILVFDKRMYYRPIFGDDEFAFNALQVLTEAEKYAQPELLGQIFVYDDGIVKGMIRIDRTEVAELYVDCFFQDRGIGAQLLEYAIREHGADHLWVVEKNLPAVRFYRAHGFSPAGERKPVTGTGEYQILMRRNAPAR